ncbi:5-oxoprolinase subunit PxpB [Oceanospirillum linum]|nr:5-oxoprolinase subunit PxpB [Oceanospirillum linum]SEF45732.1 sensor histidine kinase inhibitor, KipI family [Oleiphilus messinensis]SMP01836.1 sensor histidine kinase inhibitor, KipI family [Oceanospirillum linum]
MVRIETASTDSLILYFAARPSAQLSARIAQACEKIRGLTGITDLIPAYTTVLVTFDLLQTDAAKLRFQLDALLEPLAEHWANNPSEAIRAGRQISIPVYYHPEVAPDLEALAQSRGLTPDEVIQRHSRKAYRVAAIGFAPGFAYLGDVDASIQAPRHATPRLSVAKGSVAIAGTQTAVYPLESPGGWNIIGRTPQGMIDRSLPDLTPLAPGDSVRFEPISREQFLALGGVLDTDTDAVPDQKMQPDAAQVKNSDKSADLSSGLKAGFTVIHPGLMSQLQDAGRIGFQHVGLTTGGPLDEHAFLWGNHLLKNPWNAPAVEVSFGGLKLQAQVDTLIAVTGADLAPTLNGQPVANWQVIPVRAGDRLEFGYPRSGTRAYLAVKGGFQVKPCFGSVATVQREQMGGLTGEGKLLNFGDCLPCDEQEHRKDPQLQKLIGKRVSNNYLPDYSENLVLRVIAGYQYNQFPAEQLERFFSEEYQISPDSDRMGVRLQGTPIKALQSGITSEGIALGAIQVPPDGQPIVLMRDRQTIGGYPKLGCVYPPDTGQLAQRHPNTKVRFELMSCHGAQQDLMRFYRYFRKA